MLDAVAAEIAGSLALGGPLQEGEPSRWLGEKLLAHCEDESDAVAAECVRLRVDLAAALRTALARWPQAAILLRTGPRETSLVPPVRAEVRGTAGRSVVFDSFTVGSAPACDVQASGDGTVRPLHCVVISMPGGVAVADFWSGAAEKAFVFQHGECITLHIGDKTTVGFGPDARKAIRQLPAKAQASGCNKAGALSKRSTAFISPSRVSSTSSSRSRSPRRRADSLPEGCPAHVEAC